MRAKCANFVLCPCELLTKFRSKIRASFRDVSSVISLKQREKIRRIFEPSAKIRSKKKGRKFAAFSRPHRLFLGYCEATTVVVIVLANCYTGEYFADIYKIGLKMAIATEE